MSNIKFEEHHIVVSLELIQLLQLLSEYAQEPLKELIKTVLSNEQLSTETAQDLKLASPEDMRESIMEFFSVLETLLHETSQEETSLHQMHRLMMPSANKVDSSQCGQEIISRSAEKAAQAVISGKEESKEVFCRSLLRNWSPHCSKQNMQ